MKPELMKKALAALDQKLGERGYSEIKLLIGGGGAFGLAYQVPLQTADIDGVAFKSKISPAELDSIVKATAQELQISPDWLNPYFETFLVCLPSDYGDRLVSVYGGRALEVFALGLTDLLIMKAFAGREKDMPHAIILLKKGADLDFAEAHLRGLQARKFPGADAALEFLLEAEEQWGG